MQKTSAAAVQKPGVLQRLKAIPPVVYMLVVLIVAFSILEPN